MTLPQTCAESELSLSWSPHARVADCYSTHLAMNLETVPPALLKEPPA